jgi:anti-sigma B factor antagonist
MRIEVHCSTIGVVGVVSVLGEIDLSTAARVREAVADQIDAGLSRLVIDLTRVTFMDSTGLGLLVGTHKSTTARGGGLRVVCDNPRLLRLLTVTGLGRSMVVTPTLDAAVSEWSVATA